MGQKRVLIFSRYPLFDQGLRAALNRQPEVEIVDVCRDLETAYVQARKLRPNVVLAIAESDIAHDSAFRLLEEVAPCLIRISPTDGSMQVHRRERVDEATLDDLLLAIQVTADRWKANPQIAPHPEELESQVESYSPQPRRANMKHFVAVAVLVAVVTALVTFGLQHIQLVPPVASAEGMLIDRLFGLHVRVIAFLFALIVVFVLYSVVVFRRKPGETGDGLHIHGNTTLEIVWTLIPLGTVLYFGFLGAQQLAEITANSPDEMVVEVTGQQFAWRFDYPDYGISSTELNLPRGRQVVFHLTSTDVIHSFWVPEFRVKQDAVPGMTTTLRVTPTEVGHYKLRCAELCGTGHAYMLADVNVMEPEDFEAWVAAETAPAELAGPEYGAQLAELQGCLSCHTTDGSPLVGPTWLGLYGSEETLEDGTTILVDDEYLRRSILDPAAQIVQGFPNVMPPTYQDALSEEEVQALIEYIESLGE